MPAASRRRSGFTLVELLTVIAVIAILVSITVGVMRGARQRGAVARAKADLVLLAQALEDYKRHYGDYPQTGPAAANSFRVTVAANGTSAGPGLNTAQALLFNSLIGVYGPSGTLGGRINGPLFVDVSRIAVEVALVPTTFAVPTGNPPAKQAVNNAFLDPWGNRYMYFYKRPVAAASATTPAGPARPAAPAQAWNAPAYVLYSVGPDGANTTLPAANGVFTGTTQTTGDNADNLYADKL